MTIVSKEDTRNSEWKNNNKGSTLLKKMGWSEGQGLGRNNQGSATALRAVKRVDATLGIGASTVDTQGSEGWGETNNSFHGVLKTLHRHHSTCSSSGSGSDTDKKKKKSKSKKKSLTLAKNKVTAGHARKMRDAKDLSNKSEHDMRAIFGGTDSLPVIEAVGNVDSRKGKKNEKKRKGGSSSSRDSSSHESDSCEKRQAGAEADSSKTKSKKRKKEKKQSSSS